MSNVIDQLKITIDTTQILDQLKSLVSEATVPKPFIVVDGETYINNTYLKNFVNGDNWKTQKSY